MDCPSDLTRILYPPRKHPRSARGDIINGRLGTMSKMSNSGTIILSWYRLIFFACHETLKLPRLLNNSLALIDPLQRRETGESWVYYVITKTMARVNWLEPRPLPRKSYTFAVTSQCFTHLWRVSWQMFLVHYINELFRLNLSLAERRKNHCWNILWGQGETRFLSGISRCNN